MNRCCIAVSVAIAFAGLATSPSVVSAQTAGTIVGEVVDDTTLEPLVGATVSVVSTDVAVVTNADGHFSLPNLPAGSISIRVEQVGYISIVGEVTVLPDDVTFATLPLAAMAFLLDELRVVVDAAQPTPETAGGSFTEIYPDEGDAALSTLDLLAVRVPSIQIQNHASASGRTNEVRIRGIASVSGSNMPSIYVDGVITDLDFLAELSAGEVWRVRVLRGPSAASLYPDAVNGVIIVETLNSRRPGG